MIREMLRRIFERDGWAVLEAENGRVALDVMLEHTPAAVLLDLMMPEMDGFTFIDVIRHRGVAGLAPILVLTAKTLTEDDRKRLHSISRAHAAIDEIGRQMRHHENGLQATDEKARRQEPEWAQPQEARVPRRLGQFIMAKTTVTCFPIACCIGPSAEPVVASCSATFSK